MPVHWPHPNPHPPSEAEVLYGTVMTSMINKGNERNPEFSFFLCFLYKAIAAWSYTAIWPFRSHYVPMAFN